VLKIEDVAMTFFPGTLNARVALTGVSLHQLVGMKLKLRPAGAGGND